MKILVFGAGVLGCNLARNLCRAGKDVTLLARGKWAEEIKQNGLRIKNQLLPFPSVTHIPVVTELLPDSPYDVIFVVVRYTQLENLLEPLRKSRAKNIVFVGNNLRTDALVAQLPEKNVMFAFSLSAGHRESSRVVSIDLKKITIGQLRTSPSNKALIDEIFAGTRYKVVYQPNMGDYLLCHAAFVTPGGVCVLQNRRQLEEAQGEYGVPAQDGGRKHRSVPRHPRRRARDSAGCRQGVRERQVPQGVPAFLQADGGDEPRQSLRIRPRDERHG